VLNGRSAVREARSETALNELRSGLCTS